MSKKIHPIKLFTQAKHLATQGLNRARKILKKEIKLPPAEDVLFVLLFLFSAAFGALLFGIGEKMNQEKPSAGNYPFPSKLERNIKKMVANRPIREMAPYIARQDKNVAAYLVAIAKKESDWGKHSPKKDGQECYNYWGYRGQENTTRSGYSCFDSPKQAVAVVGERIGELIAQNIDTPKEMVIWKCGQNCTNDNPTAVRDWIHDVNLYYKKF